LTGPTERRMNDHRAEVSKAARIHPTAVVEDGAIIGEGTRIWHFAHVRADARIGRNCNLGKSVFVDSGVAIGDNVKIQNFVSVYHGVTVEDDVFIGPSATFTNDLYPRAFIWSEERVVPTRVCRGASIGANATIVCGVTIGEYSMIGAGSVVAADVPAYALVYGSPAQMKGYVCRCGRRLAEVALMDDHGTVYRCTSCGETVRIERRDAG